MGRRRTPRAKVELGDFQTPAELAADVCRLLAARGVAPRAIVEPTCGLGGLFVAALDAFPGVERALAIDLNRDYVEALARGVSDRRATIEVGDFFDQDWAARVAALPQPVLVVGNPPWVTSAELGALHSRNLPAKANFHGRAGLDALTGKSNFDISEWMLLKLLAALDGRAAVLAMLCKTAVARKVLAFAWSAGYHVRRASTYAIDAARYFGAAVDACLLVCELGDGPATTECTTFDDLAATRPRGAFGHRDGMLVADVALYEKRKHLAGACPYRWRSGIKHDCASVMELRRVDGRYENRRGEPVAIEPDLVYPMLKSADVARGSAPSRAMIVTQRAIGDDTRRLEHAAPRTWRYLNAHRERFERRASSIYRGKPPFSIFGVGDYTFAPWKVAIAGLTKRLAFTVVGPHDGKPVVLDDTCYFVACGSEQEARRVHALFSSEAAQELYAAFVFWDAKRPITTELLHRLDVSRLAG
jgi:hypothetical protein